MAKSKWLFRYEEKRFFGSCPFVPWRKPKLNQGVKQMLLQGSLKQLCVPYLADRNRQAGELYLWGKSNIHSSLVEPWRCSISDTATLHFQPVLLNLAQKIDNFSQ